mgnify:CR=1 FL=1
MKVRGFVEGFFWHSIATTFDNASFEAGVDVLKLENGYMHLWRFLQPRLVPQGTFVSWAGAATDVLH